MNRQYRMVRNSEFQYVYRRGKSSANSRMIVFYQKGGGGKTRVGFSVSKKIGNAVVRNRTKRRMRECFRLLLPQVKSGLYVIVARPQAAESTFDEIMSAMQKLLRREKLFKDEAVTHPPAREETP